MPFYAKNHVVSLLIGLLLIIVGFVPVGIAGGKDSVANVEDFRPGDTLRFTTDGSIPNRMSRFVTFGANRVHVTRTTTFKAILYRPGFLPSGVQSSTVFVGERAPSARTAMREGGSPSLQSTRRTQ